VTADDLAVWNQFPDASFALVRRSSAASTDEAEEYYLGVFDIHESSLSHENRH